MRRAVEYPDHPFDDVVDICEVSVRLSMSKYVDGFSRKIRSVKRNMAMSDRPHGP